MLAAPKIARQPLLHPAHALLLAFPLVLFVGALLSDITFMQTAEVQWTNFSAWLITGGLIMGGIALLWAIIGAIRQSGFRLFALLLAGMWIAGLINAFQHSRDGWSSVGPLGLTLSLISAALALIAAWVGYSGRNSIHREVAR